MFIQKVASKKMKLIGILAHCFVLLSYPVAQAQMPPAPQVSVALIEETEIQEWLPFSGRLNAVDSVELRPRISGQLLKLHFAEGGEVKQGDVLFEIDDRMFVAAMDQADAELAQAQTLKAQTQREAARGKDLLARRVISKEDYESRVAAASEARSAVAGAEARLRLAKLDLEFTRVTAPVSGRVGLAEVTAGNWVAAGQTLLTQVVATDRLYLDVLVDERTFLTHRDQWLIDQTQVRLGLIDDEGYPYSSTLTFIDNQVNPRTGTIQLRSTVKDSDGLFRPGFFAKASLPGKGPYRGILIHERAVATDQGARYVLVLGEGNMVQYRPVVLGPIVEGLRVVRSGLASGEKIIVNGLMKARPGAPVSPVLVSMRDLAPLDADALPNEQQASVISETEGKQ